MPKKIIKKHNNNNKNHTYTTSGFVSDLTDKN